MIQTITIIISAAIAITGWIIVHLLTQKRQIKEKKRSVRVKHLRSAYHSLCYVADNGLTAETIYRLQEALNDIQLFGNRFDIVGEIINDIEKNNTADLNEILKQLRNEIRESIGLSEIDDYRWHVRITK